MYVLDRVENIVGKEENAGYQHFLLFSQCFQKPSCPRLLKIGIMWERVKSWNLSENLNKKFHFTIDSDTVSVNTVNGVDSRSDCRVSVV